MLQIDTSNVLGHARILPIDAVPLPVAWQGEPVGSIEANSFGVPTVFSSNGAYLPAYLTENDVAVMFPLATHADMAQARETAQSLTHECCDPLCRD